MKTRSASFLLVFALSMGSTHFALSGNIQGPDLRVDEFGVQEGASIETGYMFFDGRYLERPYIVTRKGLAVFVNDTMVCKPEDWPPADYRVNQEPVLPAGITSNSTLDDVRGYLSQKSLYILQHSPQNYGEQDIETWKALPFVTNVVMSNYTMLVYTVGGGEPIHVGTMIPKLMTPRPPPTKDEVRGIVEGKRLEIEQRLRESTAVFTFGSGSRGTLPAGRGLQELPLVVSILESKQGFNDKKKELDDLMFFNFEWCTIPNVDIIVSNFTANAQLDQRMKDTGANVEDLKQKRQAYVDEIRRKRIEHEKKLQRIREGKEKADY